MNVADRAKLKKFIKKLKGHRGRHTEYVSYYIPAGYELSKVVQGLIEEQGTATNIKDSKTRKAVVTSLDLMTRTLKVIARTPPNGLAIFAGNISEKENSNNFQVFHIEPPQALNLKLYRCEQRFVLYPLEEMEDTSATYGLIIMDKNEATIGLLQGSSIKVLKHTTSHYPGKFKTGGQSAQRFERIREEIAVDFYKRIVDYVTQQFVYMKEMKGILVGGPGTSKNEFIKYFNEEIHGKIIATKDVTYTDPSGLKELVARSEDILANEEIVAERKILLKFFTWLAKTPKKVRYGHQQVKEALEMGCVEILLLFSDLEDEVIEELIELAEQSNTTITMVAAQSPEGAQFLNLTGIAALLRYEVDQ